MNDKEIENIIKRNNLIEQNLMNQEAIISEKNIIIQTKKINPFIEIIDSSRLDDNIINLNEKNYHNDNLEKETIENGENINKIQICNINNNINEEPMTFNPKKNKTLTNNLNNKTNNIESQNKNYITFKNKEDNFEIEENCNIFYNKVDENINSDITKSLLKLNENDCSIDDIITVLKKLIDKMKYNMDKSKDKNKSNVMKNNQKFLNKIKEIKNEVLKVFDKIIEEETFQKAKIEINDINYSDNFEKNNDYESQSKLNSKNYFFNEKIKEINEIENIYKTQIINLKKKILVYEKENNDLRRIIQNSQNIFEDLIYKNKLLSSKLIKYKTLYENK